MGWEGREICVMGTWSSVAIILFAVVCLWSAQVGESRLKSRFLKACIKFLVDHKNRYQPVSSSSEQSLAVLASSTGDPELH